ncbi:hypothetical protein B2J88_48600 [Rhodococcus sp. SRB_17]|nr:hypothetical protein [Rhodococcus sp. SRB_17]
MQRVYVRASVGIYCLLRRICGQSLPRLARLPAVTRREVGPLQLHKAKVISCAGHLLQQLSMLGESLDCIVIARQPGSC